MVSAEIAGKAKIGSNSPGTEDQLVRKRSPVRIRAWAPTAGPWGRWLSRRRRPPPTIEDAGRFTSIHFTECFLGNSYKSRIPDRGSAADELCQERRCEYRLPGLW